MNRPARKLLGSLKAIGFNLLDAVDRAQDLIDRDEREGAAIRRDYARDLTDYIEGPTQRLPGHGQRKDPR